MTPGRWTWTCHAQHPDAAPGARPGCGRHEHHQSPLAADASARAHQAVHARDAGCPEAGIPADPRDPLWGAICQAYDVPPVAMDAGHFRDGCPDCEALRPAKGPGSRPRPPGSP